jgi:hypothetical protein
VVRSAGITKKSSGAVNTSQHTMTLDGTKPQVGPRAVGLHGQVSHQPAAFTPKRSLVRTQYRPPHMAPGRARVQRSGRINVRVSPVISRRKVSKQNASEGSAL